LRQLLVQLGLVLELELVEQLPEVEQVPLVQPQVQPLEIFLLQ
jgi:hypothetical protein